VRVALVSLGLALSFAGVGCDARRETETLLECASPDGAYVARFYREYGGGAAGFQNEFVDVRKSKGGASVRVMHLNHGYDVVLTWLSPTLLEIGYPDSARVDHWQDWFASELKGSDLTWWKTRIKQVPSSNGSFSNERTRCVR
jgi:hypothetical protein